MRAQLFFSSCILHIREAQKPKCGKMNGIIYRTQTHVECNYNFHMQKGRGKEKERERDREYMK